MNDTISYAGIPGDGFWDKVLYLNTLPEYMVALGLLVTGIVVVKIVHRLVLQRLTKAQHPMVVYLQRLERYMYPLIYVVLFYLVFRWLTVTTTVARFSDYVFKVVLILLVIRLLVALMQAAIYSYLARHDEAGNKGKQVRGIVLILTGALWVVGLVFLFDNLGFDVTAVLAGLGVGGIAIALAAQTILGDIFNYFVIFFDRPFEVGDFIIVDDKMGTVEYVGLKTTRLRSLSGEQLIFSNTNLTNSRMHNYKRMEERRIVFGFGVPYETGSEKISAIPGMVKTIMKGIPNTRFDRAHFAKYGKYSLDFEVVYYVLSADYNRYMDIQQRINLDLYDAFNTHEIRFAYPTYLINPDSRSARSLNNL